MADRRRVPPPRTAGDPRIRTRTGNGPYGDAPGPYSDGRYPPTQGYASAHAAGRAPGPRRPDSTDSTGPILDPNAPLLDLIFPNRDQPTGRGFEPSIAHLDRAAGFGPPERAARRRSRARRMFGRKQAVSRSPAAFDRATVVNRPVRRRRILLGLGTGVVVAGTAGAAATMFTGVVGSAGNGGSALSTANGLGAAGLADSPAAAAKIAAGAKPTWPTPLSRDPEIHLVRRATFGPSLLDVVAVKQMGIDAWLERQLNPAAIADPVGEQVLATYPTVSMTTAQLRITVKDGDYLPMFELGQATIGRQMWSSRQLYEVMVDFWANHLNVVNPQDGGWDVRGPYDTEVIRAHALGRYADMLHASARSPSMMRYLNNDQSDRHSVNENYGRELLELHTVGLDAKYTEKEVRQSAYIMTGRTVDDQSRFVYKRDRHWVGKVKVLGFTHANSKSALGLTVGNAYLDYLATHPSTARRIAFKLARRFVCDDPPQTLVDRLAQTYLDGGTAIVPVLRTLFSSVEFWMSTGLKTRRPLENVVASARILGVAPGKKTRDGLEGLYWMTSQLGMAPLAWSPPDGYADYADAWGSAHATLGMWNSHRALVQGWHEGLTYPKPESFVGVKPRTVTTYVDNLALRLLHQPMQAAHKTALMKFLGASKTTKARDVRLGGKVDNLLPLLLDSVYHALR